MDEADKKEKKKRSGFDSSVVKLRFQVMPPDVDFMDVMKGGKVINRYKDEISNYEWSALQEKLFTDGIPGGRYNYNLKCKNKPEVFKGWIRSVNGAGIDAITKNDSPSPQILSIQKSIEQINSDLKKAAGGSNQIGIEFILSATKASHDSEIKFYQYQIQEKDNKIIELKTEIKSLELELDAAEKIVNELQGSGTTDKLLGIITSFIQKPDMKLGPKVKLSEKFNGSDIPEETIRVIAQIDFAKVPVEQLERLNNALNMFIRQTQLPLKEG